MSDRPLLEIRDLHIGFVRYERGLRRCILRPVSGMDLTVRRGELIALVGGSGAGKTLLAHAAMGLLPPNARPHGRVRFDGRDIAAHERAGLAGRHLGLLPQSVTFLDPLTDVGTQIRRAARLAGRGAAPVGGSGGDGAGASGAPGDAAGAGDEAGSLGGDAVADALRRRNLDPGLARSRPHQLSGGQARRILDAIATIGDPDVLFADEPTPGLDARSVAAVLDRLRDRADSGRAIVLITHDLAAAVSVADRVVVCRDGRTVSEAPASAFVGDGHQLPDPHSRALWRALPANGLHLDDPDPTTVSARVRPTPTDTLTSLTLIARDLRYTHPSRREPVLHRASLRIGSDEIVGLHGPSGIGKSTLGRLLADHLRPASGSVEVDRAPTPTGAHPVQLILQEAAAAMNPRWTIGRVLGEPLAKRGRNGAAVSDAIDAITPGLVDPRWLDRHPHELSGGELQRVNLARALLCRPRFVIADEITASLDPITVARLWRMLLGHVRDEGIGVLVISHDRPLLEVVTDRIAGFDEVDPGRTDTPTVDRSSTDPPSSGPPNPSAAAAEADQNRRSSFDSMPRNRS